MTDDAADGGRSNAASDASLGGERPAASVSGTQDVGVSSGSDTDRHPGRPSRGRPSVEAGMGQGRRAAGREDRVRVGGSVHADPGASGTVSLVGAGPGHPDLLTRRAWDRLATADVVLHDSLTDERVLEELPATVEIVDVGKRPPGRTTQAEINRLMARLARRGEHVVRLKGGDPNVFGRGGEEAEYLAGADVAFEVVPGVSSVFAAPSVSGIPLTHRDRASSVTVITGHETPEKPESALDWGALADAVTAGGTLVILMGVRRLPANVRALEEYGVPSSTPVATVERATWPDERTVAGTLADIVEVHRSAGIEPPAVTVVGDVVEGRALVDDWLL